MESWLLICGSPRPNGVSAKIARIIEMRLASERPDVELVRFDVSEHAQLPGCNGCDYCETDYACIMDDAMTDLIEQLLSADRVLMVAPVYFSGPPSQLKAVLDRLQPLYWRRMDIVDAGDELPLKRPFHLYVVGDGGDPHGYDPLVTCVRSAMAVADLRVESVQPLIDARRLRATDIELP